MRKNSSILRAALLGPFGYGNLGDAAIQESVIQNIKKRFPESEIIGLSHNPRDTELRHGIRAHRADRMGYSKFRNTSRFLRYPYVILVELWLWIRGASIASFLDIIIVSGGGQLDDYWGGAWGHPYTLFRWGLLSRLCGAKFYIISVGSGPIDNELSRFFVRIALRCAHYISYRDKYSMEYINNIGFNRPAKIYPDLSHCLNTFEYTCGKKREEIVVGIGPMSYFDPRVWPEKDEKIYHEYIEKLALFCHWLIKNAYIVLFFPGEAMWDRYSTDDLLKFLKTRGIEIQNDYLIDEKVDSVHDLMLQISRTDIVIASRFHGVLLAHVSKKPVVALSYHEKITTLMDDMGHSSLCMDIRTFTVDELIEKFKYVVNRRNAIAEHIDEKENKYKELLSTQYDEVFGKLFNKN